MSKRAFKATIAAFTSQVAKTGALICALYAVTATILYLALSKSVEQLESWTSVRIFLFILILPLILKLVVQLVAALKYGRSIHQLETTDADKPKVSVLLPAWNEEVGIIKTIQSVLNSDYQNLELVIINDGSTDQTDALIRDFIQNHSQDFNSTQIQYLSLPNGGKAKALNRALDIATGDIVITVDADCVMDPKAIDNFVKSFDDPLVGAVAGNVIIGNRKKPIEFIQQLEYVCGFFFKRADSVFNSVHIIGGAAAAYRREVLINLKGFDQELITEDVEMSMRILGHGYKTRYAHDAVIYTEGPSDWKGLCNQRLRWKFGRILTYFKHRELFLSQRHQKPYLSWLVLPLAIYSEVILLLQVALLTFFYSYTFISGDFLPLAIMIGLSTILISLQILMDSKKSFHRNLLPLVPVAWLLLYAIDFVELQALTRSLRRLAKRQSLEWQKWSRIGIQQEATKQSV